MGRLIYADAFSDFLKDVVIKQKYDRLSIDNVLTVADVLQAVCAELDGTGLERFKNAPTVDAAPVVHGHWKEDTGGYGFWICSHCGFVSEASGADILYRYCPHCGARMDGKDGDHHG